MSWWDGVRHRIGTVLFPTRYAEALKEEFEHHLALAAVNEGADGRRQFGNPTVRREEVRSLTWLGRLDVLRQDWNHVRRSVGRDPGTTALIVATLALGVGANAATFAVLDRLYFRTPEGVARPGELRRFWVEHFRTGNGVPFTSPILGYPEYLVLANSAPNPHSVAGYGIDYDLHLGPGLGGTRVRATYASANYAAVLGLRMERGRFFLPSEDQMGQGAAVAVVSNRFWREHQGGRPEAIGETIAIGRRKYQVIGVIDRDFDGLEVRASDVWIPLASRPAPSWAGRWWEAGDVNGLQAVARWPTNDPIAAAESRATNLMRQFQRQTAGARADTLRRVYLGSIIAARGPATPGQELLIASRLAGVAAIVLLISLANVISLLLARALEQQREVAVRLALGISRGRLVRLLTLEAVALALIAGLAAGLIGWSGGSLLRTLLLPEVEWTEPALDGRVILFTAIITLGVGLLTGLPTAIRTSRPDVTAALKSGSRQSGRDRSVVRSGLVVAQTALSVILLVGAALFIASLSQVRALDLGFDIDGLVVAGVEYPEGAAPPSGVIATKLREIVGRLSTHPGIATVGRSSQAPMWGFSTTRFYTDRDSSDSFEAPAPTFVAVSPTYFDAVGLQILQGATLSGADTDGAPAEVVVNDAMAKRAWPSRSPLGKCLWFESRAGPCYSVVGVVENSRQGYLIETGPVPQFYLPLGNLPLDAAGATGDVIMLRARQEMEETVLTDLRRMLAGEFPGAAPDLSLMSERLDPQYRPWRLGAELFSALGALALVVALVGIYSTISHNVRSRTREFGIRMALGAQAIEVIRQVVADGVGVVLVGVGIGVLLCLVGGRVVVSMLFGVTVANPVILGGVAGLLIATAALAALIPAKRAAEVDPVVALLDD